MKTKNKITIYRCWIIDCQTEKRYWYRDFRWYEDAEVFGNEHTAYEYEVTWEIEEISMEVNHD